MPRAINHIKPSDSAEEIVLNEWADGRHWKDILDLVAETGEDITHGQMRSIIDRARKRGDPRAVRRNIYANIVRAA